MATPDPVAGLEYAKLIDGLLADAGKVKDSLEARAAGVITTSGALVTLLFGFTAVVAAKDAPQIPAGAKSRLAVALVLIVLAAACSLLIAIPGFYRSVTTEKAAQLTRREFWIYKDVNEAARLVAAAKVDTLRSARRLNTWKSFALIASILAELAGIGFLAAAVVGVLS